MKSVIEAANAANVQLTVTTNVARAELLADVEGRAAGAAEVSRLVANIRALEAQRDSAVSLLAVVSRKLDLVSLVGAGVASRVGDCIASAADETPGNV